MPKYLGLLILSILAVPGNLRAEPIDFVRDVRPIFEAHCYDCHSGEEAESGLRLDVKSAAFKGGDNHGPDIVAGKPDESPLIHFVRTDNEDELMPPGERLPEDDIATLTRWIVEGAVWPDGVDTVELADRMDHWSFKPVQADEDAELTIDDFVDRRLNEAGLNRAAPATHVEWLRRVTFDMTGLPPTPEEVAEFRKHPDYEAVVERLLASPRYGERWAQHWLDVVRYADTHGFEVNTERPNAWPYRDYVIQAFNEDVPYDRFIREQIVGDALGEDAATGFLVTASVLLPGQIGKDEPSKRLARQDSLDEIVNNIGQTFLGLSIGCARCHDHKFDPISARDYYAMQAFVAGVEYADRPLNTPEAQKQRRELAKLKTRLKEVEAELAAFTPFVGNGAERPMVNARTNVERIRPTSAKRLRFTVLATNRLEPCIDELEVFDPDGNNVALASSGTKVTASGEIQVANRHDLTYLNDGTYGNSSSWMSNEKGGGWVILEFPADVVVDRVVWGRDRLGKYDDRLAIDYRIEIDPGDGTWVPIADASDRRKFDDAAKTPPFSTDGLPVEEQIAAKALLEEEQQLKKRIASSEGAQLVFAGKFREPDTIYLLNRGDPEQPGDVVPAAVLSSFDSLELPVDAAEQKRRMALADWIARPDNPLTARVMVNRIWQGHFGIGLVETSSDFGRSGATPTHPELLDWLATKFVENDWSIKQMHRLIVLSQTYRQSSAVDDPAAVAQDADVRLLWRFPSRRLEGEAIRDSMLAVSGELNLKMYGRGYNLFDKRGGLTGFEPVETFKIDGLRRMIYAHKVRREREAVFGAFDCPDGGQSAARRRESTTPIQALNLFNSKFTLDRADAMADRVQKEVGEDVQDQIVRCYELAFARTPEAIELADAEEVVLEYGLPVLCRVLFNCNEFLVMP